MTDLRIDRLLARFHEELDVTLPDPTFLVRSWIGEFAELIPRTAEALQADDPSLARGLLTTWARLERTKPSLVARAAGEATDGSRSLAERIGRPDLARAEEQLRAEMGRLVEVAKRSVSPKAWCDKVLTLDQAVDAAAETPEMSTWPIELLEDLDDQELLDACAAYADREDLMNGASMRLLNSLVREHADLFLPAREHILTVAQTLPAEPIHSAFLPSYRKFEVLLEEIIQAELHAFGPAVPSWFDTGRLLTEIAAVQNLVALLRAYTARRPVVLAAAGEAEREEYRAVLWLSPNSQYVAQLDWAAPEAARGKMPIRFRRAEVLRTQVLPGDPATELAGAQVEFTGLTATIDEQAMAWFSVEALPPVDERQAPQLAELIIRHDGRTEKWFLAE